MIWNTFCTNLIHQHISLFTVSKTCCQHLIIIRVKDQSGDSGGHSPWQQWAFGGGASEGADEAAAWERGSGEAPGLPWRRIQALIGRFLRAPADTAAQVRGRGLYKNIYLTISFFLINLLTFYFGFKWAEFYIFGSYVSLKYVFICYKYVFEGCFYFMLYSSLCF